jgi:AraC-like DNA-binding protein
MTHSRNPNFFKIQKAVKYIEDNHRANLCLASVAGKACLSSFHFSRVFREIMGVSFKQYLIDLKLESAKEMLRGDRTVSEAAAAVGYEEIAHFAKIFKKRTGCTPSEFRKKHAAPDRDQA